MNGWWHTQMMAGYHRQDLLLEVERDRLARMHESGESYAQTGPQEAETADAGRFSGFWKYAVVHQRAVGAAMGGLGGLIGLALLYSLY